MYFSSEKKGKISACHYYLTIISYYPVVILELCTLAARHHLQQRSAESVVLRYKGVCARRREQAKAAAGQAQLWCGQFPSSRQQLLWPARVQR